MFTFVTPRDNYLVLQRLERKVDFMAGEIERLKEAVAKNDQVGDAILALLQSISARLTELAPLAEENTELRNGIDAEVTRLNEQIAQFESALTPPS